MEQKVLTENPCLQKIYAGRGMGMETLFPTPTPLPGFIIFLVFGGIFL